MGFYIRKSISAGPFRFNLSSSGVGMSVGVKGFRVGTGPRGNYVHMGRGGLYYRASLGGARQASRPRGSTNNSVVPRQPPIAAESLSAVETGNILEMNPTNGSDIIQQISHKMAARRFWPWVLGLGLLVSVFVMAQPNGEPVALGLAGVTVALSVFLSRIDQQRKTVVIMYDLDDHVVAPFQTFAQEFDKLASASRIWNIETAGRTDDWKHHAGASHLITRKLAQLSYGVPSVIKTNVDLPCIVGGRQNIYFLPDIVLVTEGHRAGAVSYQQLAVLWSNTVFLEEDGVPSDAQVVGQTWRYVNKKGGPDRRFKDNRQIPQVLYQQMGVQGPGGLQKMLQVSQVADRSGFDSALDGLRGLIKNLQQLTRTPPLGSQQSGPRESAIPSLFKCSNCGHIVAENAQFCTGCGTPGPIARHPNSWRTSEPPEAIAGLLAAEEGSRNPRRP